MKYQVNFTLPILCCAIVEADNSDEAYHMVSNKQLQEVKKTSLDFQIIDDTPDNRDLCEILDVEQYDEEI